LTVQELVDVDASFSIAPAYPQLLSSVSGWFRSRGVPSEEAKDLGQETVVRTLVHLKRHGQRGEDLKPLVFTIARNLFTERARHGYGHVVTLTDDIDIADTAPTPLDTLMQTEERTAVSEALSSLGSRHRKVIELWMKGDTPADIARTMGIKRNAADALLHRARRRLASVLRESGQAFGGFIGLWTMRLRRAASSAAMLDPSAMLAQAASAVAAVSIAGVVAVSGAAAGGTPLHAQPGTQAPTARAISPRTASKTPAVASGASASGAAKTPGGIYTNLAPHQQRAGAATDVPGPSGASTPVVIQVWHQPSGHEGTSEGVLDSGTQTLCSVECPVNGGQ